MGALKGPDNDTINLQDAAKYLEEIKAPLLIIHGSADDNVAPTAAHKLFRTSPSLKTLCMLEGADHDLREPHWRDKVTEICERWIPHNAASSRGTSAASRSRALQRMHHQAAADLCRMSLEKTFENMMLSFEPQPQRVEGGGYLKYNACEVLTLAEIAVSRKSQSQNAGSRASLRSLEEPPRQAALQQLCNVHVQRCQKARERQKHALGGHMRGVYERFRASRERRLKERQQLGGVVAHSALSARVGYNDTTRVSMAPQSPFSQASSPCQSPSPMGFPASRQAGQT